MLYGSLSKTGRGHGTDRVLYEVLGRERTEVVFSEETPHSLPHPNTLDFFACREGKPYATMRVPPSAAATSASRGRMRRRSRMRSILKIPLQRSRSSAAGATSR